MKKEIKIEFVDLKAQYKSIKKDIDHAIKSVIEETAFIKGRFVTQFEQEFSTAYGAKHCIGVANGTDAIYIILKMFGIGAGDEVITVSNSWISTSETISQSGAKPVFVEPDEYFTIDVEKIEEKITPRTKAIIPVHLYGQACEIDRLVEICKKHNLYLIEDCAQSHFTQYKGKNVGLFGHASTFSFFPGKNLGAYGDAGAILTDSDEYAEKFRMYANHGALIKHTHLMEGINSRLDGLQAAILTAKLKHLSLWTEKRREKAAYYDALLDKIKGISLPKLRPGTSHSFHLYVILADRRDELRLFLKENGIPSELHYPCPLPFMPAYKYLNHTESEFPISKKNQLRILSLPIFPELSLSHMKYIASTIKRFYSTRK